jgi:prepilin-type processing-associated H-X9-DG protein
MKVNSVALGLAISSLPLLCICWVGFGFLLALPLDAAFNLAFGWVFFLARVVPQMAIDWKSIVTGVICLVALAVGLHWFLVWTAARSPHPGRAEGATVPYWRPRWTLMLLAVVVLMFVAGISAVGIGHQTGWLLTSPEPLAEHPFWAPRTQSMNNLKQIALAAHDYHADGHNTFPPGATFDAQGSAYHGWHTLLLPYLEHENLYKTIHLDKPWDHPDNAAAFQTRVREYLNPAADPDRNPAGLALTHYAGNARLLGGDTGFSIKQITDGTSNTLFAGEVAGNFRPWGHPVNWRDPALGINRSPDGFGSPFRGGANFVFADGSVRFIKSDVSPQVLKALSTPAGGEDVSGIDW